MPAVPALTPDRDQHLSWIRDRHLLAREHRVTVLLLILTGLATAVVVSGCVSAAVRDLAAGSLAAALGDLMILLLAALMSYGTLVYLMARIGHINRLRRQPDTHEYDPLIDLEVDDESRLLALIPAFAEEPQIARRTILSAALQPHPSRRVVLLIDDTAATTSAADLARLRALQSETSGLLAEMRSRCAAALGSFDDRQPAQPYDAVAESRPVAELCDEVADWFTTQSEIELSNDPAHSFFVDVTYNTPARGWRRAAEAIRARAAVPERRLPPASLRRVLQRALNVFDTDITSFERKRFANLSHAPNKAMNINSYISLLGGNFNIEHGENGDVLRPAGEGSATLTVPDADFILILDADTIVAADYTTKLMRRFRGAGGERLAVVQSPYSTFPGGSEVLQRVAGAQTDIQYLVHQGLTHYGATFWVGANALVRVQALREIAEPAMERGYRVMRYISDRTLIEDTESTIDLALMGWHLFNEPERLAFSLTPPDFGSLLVQRQRWASGGVLLIPKLVKHIARGGGRPRLREAFMRFHYLISLGPVSMALLIALAVTVDGELRTSYLGLLGATYYLVYMRDLVLLGYDRRDIFRVIALNLLLIPVNVVGMLRSLLQGATGRKPTFSRTPKVDRRTPVPVGFLAAELCLLLFWLGYASYAAARSAVVLAVFLSAHALLLIYALGRYVGLRNGLADMKAQLAPGTRSGV